MIIILAIKHTLVACLFIGALYACSQADTSDKYSQHVQKEKLNSNKLSGNATQMKINGVFQVNNELKIDKVDIYAYEANQLKDGVYYFQIMIKNNGNKSIKMITDQIVLVDQYGQEYHAGLVDYNLLNSIEPYTSVAGIVGFEGSNTLTPSFLRVKNT